jgi:8-oxo-dGTP pyrophosphatase MutT (NUDIX family)
MKKCSYCQKKHAEVVCRDYLELHRKNLSTESYICNYDSIGTPEQLGFRSAGICLYYIDDDYEYHCLMISERREESKNYKFNFPGGKRKNHRETPFQTALREFTEETGLVIDVIDDESEVVWYSRGKYLLYLIEIPKNNAPDIEYDNTEWVKMTDIESYGKSMFWAFTINLFDIFKDELGIEKVEINWCLRCKKAGHTVKECYYLRDKVCEN